MCSQKLFNMINVAIVIPIYNAEKYIAECLDSLLCQTYPNWTAYCVDDGSDDSSADILDVYALKDCRIKVFHKANGGVSSARNFALDQIKGDDNTWISFVDSDDYVSPTMYEDVVTVLSQVNEQECGYVRLFCEKTNIRSHINGVGDENYRLIRLEDYFAEKNVGGYICCLFVKYNLVEQNKLRFPEDMRILEDQVFSIQCALKSMYILIFNKRNYFYYLHQKSACNQQINNSRDVVKCINILYPILNNTGLYKIQDYLQNKYMPVQIYSLISNIFKFKEPLSIPLINDIKITKYINSFSVWIKYVCIKIKGWI